MVLEASLSDTINMTGLETSRHHLTDELINMILRLSLAPGGQAQITYETIHKLWSKLLFSFLDASQLVSKRERRGGMAEA